MRSRFDRFLRHSLSFAFALFAVLSTARAAQSTWTNSGTDDWFTAANWNPAGVPGSSTTVVIDNGGTATVTAPAAHSGDLTVGDSGTGHLIVESGGQLSTSLAVVGKQPGSVGTILVTGAGSSLMTGAELGVSNLNIGDKGAGTLTVADSGTVNVDVGGGLVTLGGEGGTGTVNIGVGGTAGTLLTSGINGSGGPATVIFNHTDDLTFAPPLTSSLSVTKRGGGTLTLTGTNTYGLGTTIAGGTLSVSSDSNLGGNGSLTFDGGVLRVTTTFSAPMDRATTLDAGGGTFDIPADTTLTQDGVIGGPGGLTKTGAGLLVLTAENAYTGPTTISAGTLRLGNNSNNTSTGTLAAGTTVTVANGATLDGTGTVHGNVILYPGATLGNGLTIDGTVTHLNSSILTWQGTSDANLSTAGNWDLARSPATGDSLVLTTAGVAAGTLTNDLPSTVQLWSLTLDASGGAGTYHLDDSASPLALQPSGSITDNNDNNSASDHIAAGLVLNGPATIASTNPGGIDFDGSIGGTGALTLVTSSAGPIALNADNTYDGSTTVNGDGSVVFSIPGAIPATSALAIAGSSTVVLGNHDYTVGSLAGGGTVDLQGSSTLTVGGDGSTTIFSGVYGSSTGGSPRLVKEGTGTLTLSGANTYGGGTTVSAGTLRLGAANVLGAGGVMVADGATLDLNGHNFDVTDLAGSGNYVLGGATVTVDNDTTTAFAGAFTGGGSTDSGSLTKIGSGTLSLLGTSAYTGITAVNGGTVQIAGSLTTGGLGVGRATGGVTASVLVSGEGAAVLIENGSPSFITVGDSAGSTGTLTVEDGGLVSLRFGGQLTVGWDNATGTLNLNSGGTVQVGGTNGIQQSSNTHTTHFNFAGGTIQVGLSDLTTSVPMTLSGTTSTVDTDGRNATFSAALDGDGALTKTGAGTLTLGAANTYTGSTLVAAGTLTVNGVLGTSGTPVTVIVASGATLNGAGTIWGTVVLRNGAILDQSGGLTINGPLPTTETLTWTGATSGDWATATNWSPARVPATGDELVLTGNGTPPGNNDLPEDGTVQLHSFTLSPLGSPYTLGGNAIVLQSDGAITDNNNSSGDDTINNAVTLNGPATFTSNAPLVSFHGSVSGTGGLTLVSSNLAGSHVVLEAVNDYTGPTTVSGTGSVEPFVNGAIPTGSAVTVNGELDFNGASTIGSLAGGGTVIMQGNNALTVGGDGTSTEFSGVYRDTAGAAALIKTGTGTFTLSGANTHSGGTTVEAGKLVLDNASALGTGGVTVEAGATLDLGGFPVTVGAVTFGGGTVQNGTLTGASYSASSGTIGIALGGAGGLTKTGAGTVTLASANTYGGGTTIDAGILALGHTDALGTGGLAFGDSTTLQIADDGLSFFGGITFGGNTGIIDTQANTFTYAGQFADNGSLTKIGTGTLVLSGDNSARAVAIAVNAGTLRLGNANALGTGSLSLADGATLDLNDFSLALPHLSGGGNYALGSATLTVGSDNNPTSYSGTISGTGGLTKVGTGKLNLTGPNLYIGATTIDAGMLSVNGSLDAGTTVTVSAGATLAGSGTIGGGVTAADGSTTAPGNSIGTLTVDGDYTWNAGATMAFELSATDNTSDRLAIGGVLAKSGSGTFAFDFGGTGRAGTTYTLATFASTGFSVEDFSYTNLGGGPAGTFAIVGGTQLTFTIPFSTNANLSAFALGAGTLAPAFDTHTTSYTASVPYATASMTVTPTLEDGTATVTVNGTPVGSGAASGAIALAVGHNTLTVLVTAQDGTTTRTYTIDVLRAAPVPGDVDTGFNRNVGGSVYSIAVQPDGKILLGGPFTAVDGTSHGHIARLNADGTLDPGFNQNVGNSVESIVVQADGKILLGGDFEDVNGTSHEHIARLNADGTLDPSFNPSVDGVVYSLVVQTDGKILLGGAFGTVDSTPRGNIARLNADGTLDPGFNPGADSDVYSVAVQADGKILLGGFFGTVGGAAPSYIARLEADGTPDLGFNPQVDFIVSSIAVQADGKILLGGIFGTVDGMARNGLARVGPTGALDGAFVPEATGGSFFGVASLAVQADGKILLSGDFTKVGGTPRNGIARVNPNDGSLDSAFNNLNNPNANGAVYGVAVQADGEVLLGGSFLSVGGVSRNNLARLVNDPAPQALAATSATRVEWQRGVGAPEVSAVTFEFSTDGGANWTPLGAGTRISGGWELDGLTLPASGSLRARGRTTGGLGNGGFGLVEQVQAFSGVTSAPIVASPTSADVTAVAATLGGNVTFDGNSAITERGIVYAATATNANPQIGGPGVTQVIASGTTGVFTAGVSGLTPNAGYSYAAYATNAVGTSYTSVATFTTLVPGTNANLSALAPSAGPLSPAFASGVTSYTVDVENATSSFTVTPTLADATASVTVNGTSVASGTASAPIALVVGANPIAVHVTAQDGTTTQTYTITVTRAASPPPTNIPATVALGGLSQVYDGTAKPATATTDPAGLTVTLTYDGSGTPPTAAGSYGVLATITAPGYTGSASGTLTIAKATPAIAWPAPGPIVAGTVLSGAQLAATASTAGTFSYSPAAGAVLPAGTQPLTLSFTPADTANYVAVTATTSLTVLAPPVMVTTKSGPILLPTVTSTSAPIAYRVLSGPGIIDGGTLTLTGTPGTVVIEVTQAADADHAASTTTLTFDVPAPNVLVNASSRGTVLPNSPLIAGFVVGGSGEKPVLVRAIGPSLAGFGVSGVIPALTLQLFDAKGSVLATNSAWGGSASLAATFAQVGAFALEPTSGDAALVATLRPGNYTAVVSGASDVSGVALAEVYDASATPLLDTQRVVNLSARGAVAAGQPLIAGFVVTGSVPKQVLVRGIGSGLAPFGITDALADPQLAVFDNRSTLIAQNDNWETPVTLTGGAEPASPTAIAAAESSTGAFNLTAGGNDAAVLITLSPGAYTAVVTGVGTNAGTALVEIYEVP